MTDELTHNIEHDIYTLYLQEGDEVNLAYHFTANELRRAFMVLVAHYCDCSPECTTTLRGLVTGTYSDANHEQIIEWVGLPKSAQWRAKKLVTTGKLKGARAWLNIANTGIFTDEWPGFCEDEETDNEDTEEKETQTKMDRWFE